MNKKIKISLFTLGGAIVIVVAFFLRQHYSYNKSNKSSSATEVTTGDCDSSSGNCGKEKKEIDNPIGSGNSSENNIRLEQKVPQEIKNNNSDSSSDPDEVLDENKKKFDSDEDEEDTNDGVMVEVGSDDE